MAGRLKLMGSAKYQTDGDPRTSGPGFGVALHEDALTVPIRWKKPRLIFVDSMSDLWHKDIPDPFILDVFSTMGQTPRHTYQILTKRPQRQALFSRRLAWHDTGVGMEPYLRAADTVSEGSEEPLPNVMLGTSIESDRYTFRANFLRETNAAVRFLSCEPLLGPLPSLNLAGIGWVIAGAESGHGARPMDLDWVREIRDRCVLSGVPFFFKQAATASGHKIPLPELDGRQWAEMPELTGGSQ